MKCRTKREMSNPQAITMKNGRPAIQGVCQVCSTKLFRIVKSSYHAAPPSHRSRTMGKSVANRGRSRVELAYSATY